MAMCRRPRPIHKSWSGLPLHTQSRFPFLPGSVGFLPVVSLKAGSRVTAAHAYIYPRAHLRGGRLTRFAGVMMLPKPASARQYQAKLY